MQHERNKRHRAQFTETAPDVFYSIGQGSQKQETGKAKTVRNDKHKVPSVEAEGTLCLRGKGFDYII